MGIRPGRAPALPEGPDRLSLRLARRPAGEIGHARARREYPAWIRPCFARVSRAGFACAPPVPICCRRRSPAGRPELNFWSFQVARKIPASISPSFGAAPGVAPRHAAPRLPRGSFEPAAGRPAGIRRVGLERTAHVIASTGEGICRPDEQAGDDQDPKNRRPVPAPGAEPLGARVRAPRSSKEKKRP